MESSPLQALVAAAGTAQVLGLAWVGVRLVRLSRRTRGAPELLMGLSFLSLDVLGVPLLLVSGYGGSRIGDMNVPLFAIAILLANLGALLFMAFVWRVFRPDSRAGKLAVIASGIVLAVHWALSIHGLVTADPDTAPIAALGLRGSLMTGVLTASFVWGSVEACFYWARLRRQQALGLADASSVRRMGWFGIGCAAPLVMMGFVASAIAREVSPHSDPPTALAIALCALAVGAAFTFAFGAQHSASPAEAA